MIVFPAQSKTETKGALVLFAIILIMACVCAVNFSSNTLLDAIVSSFGIAVAWGWNFYFFGWEKMRFAAITLFRGSSEHIEAAGKEKLSQFLTGHLLEKGLHADSAWTVIATSEGSTKAPALSIRLIPDQDAKSSYHLDKIESLTAMWVLTQDGDPYRLIWMRTVEIRINLADLTAHEKMDAMQAHSSARQAIKQMINDQAGAAT